MVAVMLLPIGRFARASRLSVKSLRNYDESGLLPAAFVDPQSGYRYYRLTQLPRAQAIRALRLVDMPLDQIAELLDGPSPERTLAAHLAALVDQREEYDRKVSRLQRLISRKELTMSSTVTIKQMPAQRIAAYRTPTTATAIFTDIPAGFERVLGVMTRGGAEPAGAPFTVIHQVPDADTSGEISLCVPVTSSGAFGEVGDQVTLIDLPPGVAAAVVHEGSYEDMGDSYATVSAWIHERGHRIVGPSREVYLNSPADVDEDDLRTEILFPIVDDGSEEID